MSDPLKDALARGDDFRRAAVGKVDDKVSGISEKLGWPRRLGYAALTAALLLVLWLVSLMAG
jgi:hypothetical protein